MGLILRSAILLSALLFLPFFAWGQKEVKVLAIAEVIQDGAMVYKKADFDSSVVSYLTAGDQVGILSKRIGPFYKIATSTITGYISDVDVRIIKVGKKTRKSVFDKDGNMQDEEGMDAETPEDGDKHIALTRSVGLELRQIEFREVTARRFRKEDISGTGFKIAGRNILVPEAPMEMNFFFITQVPSYYQEITGRAPGGGMVLLWDALFLTPFAGDRGSMFYSGFGPMAKLSQFNVTAGSDSKTFDMLNLSVGAAATIGYGVRLGRVQLRFDYKYYWEKEQHNGLGMSLLWDSLK